MKRIEVAVGVLFRQQKVLVAQRLVKDRYFEKWEFPGGKLEQNESAQAALSRELFEELGVRVKAAMPLIQLDHDYPDRQVRLHVFEVTNFTGEPYGREGQAIRWVQPSQCAELDFLQANRPIVNAAILPKLLLVTDIAKYSIETTLARIDSIQREQGDVIIQLREQTQDMSAIKAYYESIMPLLSENSLLVLNGEPEVAKKIGFDGVHLNAVRAGTIQHRDELALPWVGVSCHDQMELRHAEEVADFALLSPIKRTGSHPDCSPKGWGFFQCHAQQATMPVYALGGLSFRDADVARLHHGQGVAVLSAAWEC